VKKARFLSFGSGTAIASCDAMCELIEGKTMDEALEVNNIVVEKFLRDDPNKPSIPTSRMHCSVMVHDVIKEAVANYKGVFFLLFFFLLSFLPPRANYISFSSVR
jgi:NifU-like protein